MAIRIGLGQLQRLSPDDAAFARQLGLTTIQLNTPAIPSADGLWHEADLVRLRDDIAAEGLTLEALENVPIAFYDKVMLGKPGWEDQLERYCTTIRQRRRGRYPASRPPLHADVRVADLARDTGPWRSARLVLR